jgi:hypothetical protein
MEMEIQISNFGGNPPTKLQMLVEISPAPGKLEFQAATRVWTPLLAFRGV